MTALNNLFTEEIAGTIVLVSFDYNTQTFKVVNKQTEDILIDGDDISVNAFLEKNGARVFSPRYMANDPVTTVNANNADKTHYSPWAVLLYLKNRAESYPLEMIIYPRDYQEGAKFLPGIKIPLGECVLDNINKSSIVNLLMTQKDLLKDINKVAVRTYTESANREVALVAGTNKYYPMSVNPEDIDSFANSLILVVNSNGNEIDEEKLKKALNLTNTMSVLSSDENTAKSVVESMSFDDIINKHIVVFESKDLNSLSRTLFHVHPEASYHNWKVSEIKENSNHDGFLFEVFGEATDNVLNDDFILGRLLSENVYITHRTPMHESSCAEKAIFSLMHGASMNDITSMILTEHAKKSKQERILKECGLGGADISGGVSLPIMDVGVTTVADVSPSCVTSSDIHGIQGKVLAPMIPEKKAKKVIIKKKKSKKESLIDEKLLEELGILDSYNKLIGLTEDDDIGADNISNDSSFDNLGDFNDSTDISDNTGAFDNTDVGNNVTDFGNFNDLGSNDETTENASEESNEQEQEDVGVVKEITEEGKLKIAWEDGTSSEENTNNVLVTSSKHPDIQI